MAQTQSQQDTPLSSATTVENVHSRLVQRECKVFAAPEQIQKKWSALKTFVVKVDLYICNSSLNIGRITEVWQTCFTVDWSSEIKCYFWERDDQIIAKLAIAPQPLIDKFLEDSEPLVLCPSCELQQIYLSGGCGICGLEPAIECTRQLQVDSKSSLGDRLNDNLDRNGLSQPTPENFLKESNEDAGLKQSSKRRQRKGCLYKYIENKKLKDGTITSYPRVIGHRNPDNPTHWRWGFNWEEKIDGEWKGRSIGSVPVGAVPMIQSMQREGASLEEIIGFIKRAKAKK